MSRPVVARYSRISARFWTDEKSSVWPDRVKLGALYILTCPHRHLEGIFKLPPQYACADLQWTLKTWNVVLSELQEYGFLKWDSQTQVVLVVNALRYQAPENPNQTAAALQRIKDLPNSHLLKDFCSLALDHCYRKGATAAAQGFAELLRQQLRERLGERLDPLNLNLKSEAKPETKSESESEARRRDRGLVFTNGKEEERTAQLLNRYPHLRETES
ncbi:MAG: hypothetical protein JSS26_08395 [Nitrospira sp.]|nr:hypothetical protein [Nitrospira sp.]